MFKHLIPMAMAAALTLFMGPDARGQGEPEPQEQGGDRSGIEYEVTFQGISDKKTVSDMKSVSDAWELRDRPPASLVQLRQRAERDRLTFLRYLKSKAYYDAVVLVDIDTEKVPPLLMFQVATGSRYPVERVRIQIDPQIETLRKPFPAEIGLVPGDPAESAAILAAESELERYFKRRGFPAAKAAEREVIVDHGSKSVSVKLSVTPGPRCGFGPVSFKGLDTVKESYVRTFIPWQRGDLFSEDLLLQLQRDLIKTGLFASVRVTPGSCPQAGDLLPIQVVLSEKKHHSVGFGASYMTDEGPGANASWEDRNLAGAGERLRFFGSFSDFTREVRGTVTKPRFLRNDQVLKGSVRLADDRPDAFESRNLEVSLLVDRELSPVMVAGAGLAYKLSKVEQVGEEDKFSLISLPMHLERDLSNDFLNPARGYRLALWAAPFYDFSDEDVRFGKGWLGYRHYVPLFQDPMVVLAGRCRLGSIVGVSRDRVPADERFYAGGGGSIRGYSYQSVGPLSGDDPVGGRSLFEISGEVRMKITPSLGVVGFLDGGSAFESAYPDFEEETVRWGAGVGLRYYTRIGPLRLDVGFPLSRRDMDDSFQIYLSIGQAF